MRRPAWMPLRTAQRGSDPCGATVDSCVRGPSPYLGPARCTRLADGWESTGPLRAAADEFTDAKRLGRRPAPTSLIVGGGPQLRADPAQDRVPIGVSDRAGDACVVHRPGDPLRWLRCALPIPNGQRLLSRSTESMGRRHAGAESIRRMPVRQETRPRSNRACIGDWNFRF
jgi:hypothetical protein